MQEAGTTYGASIAKTLIQTFWLRCIHGSRVISETLTWKVCDLCAKNRMGHPDDLVLRVCEGM